VCSPSRRLTGCNSMTWCSAARGPGSGDRFRCSRPGQFIRYRISVSRGMWPPRAT